MRINRPLQLPATKTGPNGQGGAAESRPSQGNAKVLVISGTTPGAGGVGNLLLNDCCESIGKDSLFYVAFLPNWALREVEEQGLVDQVYHRKYETGFRPIRGLLGQVVSALSFRILCAVNASRLARQVKARIQRDSIHTLFAVLDSPTSILVASKLAKKLRVRVVTFVMDAPEHISYELFHDRFTARYLKSAFRSLLNSAVRCGVAGESMKERYEHEFGIPCFIIRQGVVHRSDATNKQIAKSNSPLIIGFGGTITARDAFGSMIRALDSVGWVVAGRRVILRIVGGRIELKATVPQHIEYYGWQSRQGAERLLSECGLLYLPQPFSEERRSFAELSFPNKLITYVGAGRPVLLHAPNHASLIPFVERFDLGTHCNSMQADAVLTAIARHAEDHSLAVKARNGCRRAIAEELNVNVLARNCHAMLASSEN